MALATVEDVDNDLDLFTCEPVINLSSYGVHHRYTSSYYDPKRLLPRAHENWLSSTTRSFVTNEKRDLFTDLLGQFAVL